MPNYDLRCGNCLNETTVNCSMSDRNDQSCTMCNLKMSVLVRSTSFMLKGDNWSGKLIKETEFRKKRSEVLDRRQRKEHSSPKVAPNVEGEIVGSWKEAKKLASDKGYNTSTYDKFIK